MQSWTPTPARNSHDAMFGSGGEFGERPPLRRLRVPAELARAEFRDLTSAARRENREVPTRGVRHPKWVRHDLDNGFWRVYFIIACRLSLGVCWRSLSLSIYFSSHFGGERTCRGMRIHGPFFRPREHAYVMESGGLEVG